jgi:hypothetical protein
LETYIHWLLHPNRAPNGEFFNVTEIDLDRAIDEAKAFISESAPILKECQKLQKKKPCDEVLEASDEALSLHRDLSKATREANLLEQRIALLQGKLEIAIGDNLGIKGVASWKWREQWRLDQTLFQKEHPALFDQI